MKKYLENDYMKENMMGPNAIKLLKEMLLDIEIKPQQRVMDLGCGKGLTSMYLADNYDIPVYAVDLWIEATENYKRFCEMSLGNKIIPIHADVHELPFAHDFFDAVISVDSFAYYGREENFMDSKLAPFVKKGGLIAFCVPGLKKDIHSNIPPEMLLSWSAEDLGSIQTAECWTEHLKNSKEIEILSVKEMQCFEESWNDWLESDNEYAVSDRAAMNAGAGKYMNFVFIVCRRK